MNSREQHLAIKGCRRAHDHLIISGKIDDALEEFLDAFRSGDVMPKDNSKLVISFDQRQYKVKWDLDTCGAHSTNPALEKELNKMIGLESIKNKIRELYAAQTTQKRKEEHGFVLPKKQRMHIIFAGNPGVGKTSLAKLVGQMLYEIGEIPSEEFREVQRGDLVGQVVGETRQKTKAEVNKAGRGILFVDEAYQLAGKDKQDYGNEAIDEIMKAMNDPAGPLIFVAGYPDKMEEFLQANPGLKSRFATKWTLPNYSPMELARIFVMHSEHQNLKLQDVRPKAIASLIEKHTSPDWREIRNGRVAEKFLQLSAHKQELRLSNAQDMSTANILELQDIEQAAQELASGW